MVVNRPAPGGRALSLAVTWFAIVVLVVIGVGMLWPKLRFGIRDGSNIQGDVGNNMRGIISMHMAYAIDHPDRPLLIDAPDRPTPLQAAQCVILGWERVRQTYPDDIKRRMFLTVRPPPGPAPESAPLALADLAYAWDWGAPGNQANRIVFAERPPSALADKVLVAYSDTHVAYLALQALAPYEIDPANRTIGRDGKPVPYRALTADGDDIFLRGDGGSGRDSADPAVDVWVR